MGQTAVPQVPCRDAGWACFGAAIGGSAECWCESRPLALLVLWTESERWQFERWWSLDQSEGRRAGELALGREVVSVWVGLGMRLAVCGNAAAIRLAIRNTPCWLFVQVSLSACFSRAGSRRRCRLPLVEQRDGDDCAR
jgi:hypothetical protein